MRILKTFSFTDKDIDIIKHIESKENMSKYIKDLVRKDMKEVKENNIEKIVKNCIEKYLKDKKIQLEEAEELDIDTDEVVNILNM